MNPKKFLKNKSICTLPWSGFQLESTGVVKNCIISKTKLGNINDTNIRDILSGKYNTQLKESMIADKMPANCSGCHLQETNRSDLTSISSRLYYHKELGTKIPMSFYEDVKNFSLKHVDLRWTNACNQACVYCDPRFSSKWAQELGVKIKSHQEAREDVKQFVYDNIQNLENVYLAGGEPMLMKENSEFLELLKRKNPNCSIRVNTNLSTTSTGIFELLCSFKKVHWTVSVETIESEYEYVRHHGKWKDFCQNLDHIKRPGHKISFNMLHFILNYKSIHDCVKFLKNRGFHDNSFIIGPLFEPTWYNNLNLPTPMLEDIVNTLKKKLQERPEGYLKNSYENLLSYYTTTTWTKNLTPFYENIKLIDKRRHVDSKKVFTNLYEELNAHAME